MPPGLSGIDRPLEMIFAMLSRFYPEAAVRTVFIALILAQVVLVVCHVGAIVLDTFAPSENTNIVRAFFSLNKEGNAPTWFSSLLFLLIGFACAAIYFAEGHLDLRPAIVRKTRPAWLLFAGLFLFLSFDETSQLHERLDWMISGLPEGGHAADPLQESDTAALPFYKYLLIYFPVLGALGLAMGWFVIYRFRWPMTAFLFFLGMALLASKLVIESFEKWSLATVWFNHAIYLETVIVEMCCLFTGATIVFTSLLNYLMKLLRRAFTLRAPIEEAASSLPMTEPSGFESQSTA